MKIKDLEYFLQLSKTRSFTKTALFFGVRQPTITYAMKRLEEDLKTKLFFRNQSHQQIELTPAGRLFALHAQKMIAELSLAKVEIARLAEEKVVLGLPPIVGNYYFPKVSKALMDRQLLTTMEIINGGSQDLYRLLSRGQIDLAIIGSTTPLFDEKLQIDYIATKKFKIVVSPKHDLAKQQSVSFKDLVAEKFVVLNEHYIHPKALNKLAKQAGFQPTIVYQNSDLTILKGMIRENIGIGFLAEIAIEDHDELVVLDIEEQNQPLFFVSMVKQKNMDQPLINQSYEVLKTVLVQHSKSKF